MLSFILSVLKWAAFVISCLAGAQIILHAPALIGMIDLKTLWPFLAASGAFLLAYHVFIKRFVGSLEILQHELTHILFGLLFFMVPTSIVAVSDPRRGLRGGEVRMMGGAGGGNFLISLSPYWFPLLAVAFWGLCQVVDLAHAVMAKQAVAISYTWFMLMNIKQFHLGQTDLRRQGLLYSVVFLLNLNLFILLLVIFFLQGQAQEYLNALFSGLPQLPGLPDLPDWSFDFGLGWGDPAGTGAPVWTPDGTGTSGGGTSYMGLN